LGRDEEARQALLEASQLALELESRHEVWPVLASLALADLKTSRRDEAGRAQAHAREIIESIATGLSEPAAMGAFLNQGRCGPSSFETDFTMRTKCRR
jgi:hypothetical protein